MTLQWFCVLVQLDLIFVQTRFLKDPPAFLLDFYIFSVCRKLREITKPGFKNKHYVLCNFTLILDVTINENIVEKSTQHCGQICKHRKWTHDASLLDLSFIFYWFGGLIGAPCFVFFRVEGGDPIWGNCFVSWFVFFFEISAPKTSPKTHFGASNRSFWAPRNSISVLI